MVRNVLRQNAERLKKFLYNLDKLPRDAINSDSMIFLLRRSE